MTDTVSQTLLVLLGAVLGTLGTLLYEKQKDKRRVANVSALVSQEIERNVAALAGLLQTVNAYLIPDLPQHIDPLSFKEVAERVEAACETSSLQAIRSDLPSLEPENTRGVLDFYNSCRDVPNNLRNIERFAGNVRSGLFQSNIQTLIEKGVGAIAKLRKTA
jgi:hypothetical protein